MNILEMDLIDYQLRKKVLLTNIDRISHRRKIFLRILFVPALLNILYMIYMIVANFDMAVNKKGLLGFIFTESGMAMSFLILCSILLIYITISVLVSFRTQHLVNKFKKTYDNNTELYEEALHAVKCIDG